MKQIIMKEKIAKIYAQALIDGVAPDVFADQVLNLLTVSGSLITDFCNCVEPDRESGYSYCHRCHKKVSNDRMDKLTNDEFPNKIEQIGQTYHERICSSGLVMDGQICGCCKGVCSSTISLEHDSRDYSKDLKVCGGCYSKIISWWTDNKPRKISPV